ncbi:hypothetical protein K2173_008318 [Erythroxylum novogranatense]|uniref:RNA-binding protein 25 n=1 Tax=Erythroxylum novogranatense TaxID=1862640 RepID=A0AAV8U6A2_9ROSI|nr:hypothetical protein K2173_008318 [Erythroxylum novogranatense]
MADPLSSSAAQRPESGDATPLSDPSALPTPQQQSSSATLPPNPNPNPNLNPNPSSILPSQQPLPVHPYPPAPPQLSGVASVPPVAPSFRPAPQFSPLPNYPNPSVVAVQPPGVTAVPGMVPSGVSGGAGVPMPAAAPMMAYQVPAGQPPRPYAPLPNGYGAASIPPPGIPRYPSPYPAMVRPLFPPRPPGTVGILPAASRPLIPGVPGVHPLIPPIARPAIPSVTPAKKPQTTVYVGKIAATIENDFMLSLLKFCGPVKSWKREQDPSDGTLKGFGFCEFESADGVLRALRLLSKFNIDGQELVLNVSQATREYLEKYVENKTENAKNAKDSQAVGAEKDDGGAQGVQNNEVSSTYRVESNNDGDKGNKENHDVANFGIVTDEDKEGDREAMEKLRNMIEERLKTKPLPPPPQTPTDDSGNSNLELPTKSRDVDSHTGITRNDAKEDNNEDETSDNKGASELDGTETSSPDRNSRHDRRSRDRDRDRERDKKREKEREIERYEREAERERVRKEREQRRKIEEAEREYEERLKDWEYREREKEKQRQYDKDKEKERERKRRKEVLHEEEDEDDAKRWRRSVLEEKRRKRLWEKEEDEVDRLKEEEEIAEDRKRAEEEKLLQQQREALKLASGQVTNNGSEMTVLTDEAAFESKDMTVERDRDGDSGSENRTDERVLRNGSCEESAMGSAADSDVRQGVNAPGRKLGFGLVGSGKRATVPSVFHEEDDDEAHKDKKMRPLVPIDYSTEELQAIQPASGGQPPNLVAAAEYAKRISNVTPKEEKPDAERERSRRSHDRSSQRDRDRNDEERTRSENKDKNLEWEKDREHGVSKVKAQDKQKLLDAKQLIDMIPKTKDELFSYEINWSVYDQYGLHERMRPWISKKITEFLGEEEKTLVDYIVSSTQEHVKASQMLEMLQTILDEEAEMFVLKMWRMLIFEIKKVETGLAVRSKT